ncbi:MAG: AraC family transcriptional regulator [Lachnospiraceae bacterium]
MQLQINHENREIKEHGTFSYPVRVSYEVLSAYERGSFFWHWHPEVELTLILEGDIKYQVNDKTHHLKAGDGLFCNSNMPHTGIKSHSADCIYISITFDPKIIYGFEASTLHTKYVVPLTQNSELDSVVFQSAVPWQRQVLMHLQEIWDLNQHAAGTYEFQIQILLAQIWLLLYEHAVTGTDVIPSASRDRERILAVLSYLHDHYSEKIKLADIAAQINICPGECCRFFKKHMKQSIFDYLIRYRIERSLPLLRHSADTITDISLKVGFSSPCYFSKMFRAEMNCSPKDFRKTSAGIE